MRWIPGCRARGWGRFLANRKTQIEKLANLDGGLNTTLDAAAIRGTARTSWCSRPAPLGHRQPLAGHPRAAAGADASLATCSRPSS